MTDSKAPRTENRRGSYSLTKDYQYEAEKAWEWAEELESELAAMRELADRNHLAYLEAQAWVEKWAGDCGRLETELAAKTAALGVAERERDRSRKAQRDAENCMESELWQMSLECKEESAAKTAALERIRDIIHEAENRCMAADGPVTKTSDEITERDLQCIYALARGHDESWRPNDGK